MSLAVIFVVGFFGLGLALTITMVALVGLNKNYNTNSGNQTFYTAEAAAREGVYQYLSTSTYSGGNAFPELINNASDTVSVDASGPIFTFISGNAENNLTYRTVKYKLERIPGSMTFSYAIFATGELTMHGGAGLNTYCVDGVISCGDFPLGASVFSNEDMTLKGAPHIGGGAYAAGTIDPPGNPSNIEDGVQDSDDGIKKISMPEIDLQPYRDEAIAGSTLFPTSAGANAYLVSATTGTVFVEQDTGTTIIHHKELDGTLVTQNSLDVSHGTYGTTDFSRAALIVEGDLDIGANTTLNGIIYVKGTTRFTGDGIINGALISVGGTDVEIGGSIEIYYNPDISQEFQNIPGLDKTPEIIGWQEQ